LRAAMQTQLEQVRREAALPGLAATVVTADGTAHAVAVGYADVERRAPMTPGSVMPAGSIGKQFVAAVALSLEHEGRVDLDVPIQRWFANDAWFDRLPNARAITLRMLLMHRSGLGDHRESERFFAAIQRRFEQVPYDPDFRIPPEELVAIELDTVPLFAPGADMRYSETGYILAGMALERACGCNYYDELERRILKPLRLEHTRPATTRDVPGLAQGYIGDKVPGFPATTLDQGRMRFSPATEWTGGGLYSNTIDLAHWSKALYEGRVMQSSYVDELLAGPPAAPGVPARYAMGVYVMQTPDGVAYGHGGEFPGYYSYTCYLPDSRTSVALQTNTASTDVGVLRDAAFALLRTATRVRP